jgi:tellurite resistance protein
MTNITPKDTQIELLQKEGLDFAGQFVKNTSYEDVQSGEWFLQLLKKVLETNKSNARAAYFQQKYAGLPADDIADTLISITAQYAAIGGAIAGVTTTAGIAGIVTSGGMSAALWISSLGIESVYVSWLQMRLILDLTTIYDLQIDPDDPEDILMIFGYAIGTAPSEFLGKGIEIAAGSATKYAVKKYISGGTLKSVQEFARRIGFKVLQRSIVKFAVPVFSAIAGGSYNYVTTYSVGRIAKENFRHRGEASEELRRLVSKKHIYDITFPATLVYMAESDGNFNQDERNLYKSILGRMSLDSFDLQALEKLVQNENDLLELIGKLDYEASSTLFHLLKLMAVYDGHFDDREGAFLVQVAGQLNIPIDLESVRQEAEKYRVVVKQHSWDELTGFLSQFFHVAKKPLEESESVNDQSSLGADDSTSRT